MSVSGPANHTTVSETRAVTNRYPTTQATSQLPTARSSNPPLYQYAEAGDRSSRPSASYSFRFSMSTRKIPIQPVSGTASSEMKVMNGP